MKTMQQWLDEYGSHHQNGINKIIHWICVPLIFFSVVGLLYSVKIQYVVFEFRFNLAVFALVFVMLYYQKLSVPLSFGMFLFSILCLFFCNLIEINGYKLWLSSIIIFVAAWIGQFIGHKIEGQKPSFLDDLQFLLIGPAWLMSFIYKKIGVKI
ncbi:MAG: DUF962 domain-containing protein [Bacteroidetes bacterium]|nr:DUF962 domain-containing protein [Bacteroidota bacterium]